jgi:Ras-related protein Rab-5C
VVVIFFDITNEWLSEFCECGQPSDIVVAAVNKADLEAWRQINRSSAQDFAFESQSNFLKETSARYGPNIKELFTDLAKQPLALPPVKGFVVIDNAAAE